MQVNSVNLNDLTLAKADPKQAATAGSVSNPTGLGRDDFLKMLVAQLENQDPLNPQDGTEFTAQLAQFSSLEQLITIRENLDQVVQSQRELTSAIHSLASSSLIGREAVARGNQMEIGSDGNARVAPAFELASPSSSTTLTVRAASGHSLGSAELGPLGRGFHRVPEEMLAQLDLASGQYEFEIEALSGGRPVETTLHSVGVISSAVPGGEDPTVQIGGISVPYSEVSEIREREQRPAAAPQRAGAREPNAAAGAAASSAAPSAASSERSASAAPLAAAAARVPASDAERNAPLTPPRNSSTPARAERIAETTPATHSGRSVHSSGLTGKAASNPAPARPPAIA